MKILMIPLLMGVMSVSAGVREDFANPPPGTGLQMWFHWNGDGVTREGLSRDLKAMGELGVDIAHVISPNMAYLPKTAVTMSPEWLDLFAFAIAEAKKNGVRLSFHNCPGWSSSGGPWISPENAMKIVVASETDVDALADRVRLPQPMTLHGFYRDIAVSAIPLESPVFRAVTKPVEVAIRAEGAVETSVYESASPIAPTQAVLKFAETSFHADCDIEASADGAKWTSVGKAPFRFFRAPATPKVVSLRDVPEGTRFFRVTFRHAPPLPWVSARDIHLESLEFNSLPMIAGVEQRNSATSAYGYRPDLGAGKKGIDPARIVDLTAAFSADGSVDLGKLRTVDRGRRTKAWRIMRIGYTCKDVGPAPATIGGLECDKLDRKGIEAHWAGMPARILALPGAKGTVVETYIDSYEVGGQNWSECLPDEFARRRGYPIGKNLISVCGYQVGDGKAAADFLWDFQRTIGELFAENYYDRFAELCRANGIRAAAQTYGGPFDVMRAARNMDEPQAEFWMSGSDCHNSPRLMASVSHLYGKRITSAECFTSEQANGRWLCSPHWYRTVGDRYGWLNGVNAFVCHSYCHQPFTNVIPGISLGRHGSQFNVNTTWWKDAWAWRDYVRRGQALLQYGEPRAEVLVLGSGAPDALLAAGFNHDLCSEYDVAALEARPDGLGMPGRPSYRMLVVQPAVASRLMTTTRAKLKALAAAGVKVVTGDPLEKVREAKLRAPFEEATRTLRAIRREGAEGETIWFVVNTAKSPFSGEATFLAKPGTRPEFFDAKTGEISAAAFVESASDRLTVKLDLAAEGSAFIVFSKTASSPSERARCPSSQVPSKVIDLSTGWTITSFDGRNAPAAPLALSNLVDWSHSPDPKLRYFSGRAVYEKAVEKVERVEGVELDLGEVHEIANVYVNGKFIACLWEPPYRVALPSQLLNPLTFKPFNLKVELVNLLPNRLIGDAIALKNGAKEEVSNVGPWPKWVIENRSDSGTGIFSWTNFRPAWTAEDRPIPSGLVGPVKLICHTGCAARGEADAVKLPGEPCTAAPIPCAPFPDRLSAYVWRNWNLVPLKRLASVVKARPADLEQVAADLGLEPAGAVLPEWRRKGYITLLRRNWHLLDYDQLTELVDMTRRELAFSLVEEDFLWVKLGRVKPKCGPFVWTAADASDERRAARRRIASVLAEEGLDPSAGEEPRFAFISDLARTEPALPTAKGTSPFDFRLIFSYFADYVDPLGDSEVRSYPEGLLQQLSRQGVNAVWLHAVLRTLAKDPKYPEWGEGSERRIANLKMLVARAAKYGIKVYLYVNEPRGMDEAFFRADPAREAFHGARDSNCDIYALCPSHPEPLRWLSDSLAQVFAEVPGLGGVFTITMSENMTHCKARHSPKPCARCAQRPAGDIIAAVNRAIVEGMRRGNPQAEAVLYTWNWPEAEVPEILAKLPKEGCRIMTVSEHDMKFVRGGIPSSVYDYAISVVGPGEHALKVWNQATAAGFPTVAKVQVANSWELSTFPYLPLDELNARHAVNLANAGVRGVMLSWSCGSYPAPNLAVYNELRAGERTPDALLDRLAAKRYGAANVARVRRAWKAFADGFQEFPFHVSVAYFGPQHWGVANPLYLAKTGYHATMVGLPYDDLLGWRGQFPPEVYIGQMDKVAAGFDAGCRELEGIAGARELALFRAEQLHFASVADQARFVVAREKGDRKLQLEIARRELKRARTYLPIVRADSRIGYESSNHYFFLPRDVLEKALSCRQVIDALSAVATSL